MLTEKQLKIFEVFVKRPFAEITRGEVKREAKEKSNNTLALTINLLKEENVLKEKKVGKSGLLTLNFENDRTIQYIALCNNNRLSQKVQFAIESLKKEISERTPFYAMSIFGSYAVGEQKKNSDLDIAIFIQNTQEKKLFEASGNSAQLKNSLEMDIQIITREEMLEMLTSKEENLGKQIAKKHISIANQRIFYEIIKEGMAHGFRT
jgi:predicted nucleotidyltransferase